VLGPILGPILGIDYWIAKYFVPFPNLPMVLSGGSFTVGPIAILLAVTIACTAVGLTSLKRRDLS
jgi:ABC-2 type transport system permease protein